MELKWWMLFDYFVLFSFCVAYVSASERACARAWVSSMCGLLLGKMRCTHFVFRKFKNAFGTRHSIVVLSFYSFSWQWLCVFISASRQKKNTNIFFFALSKWSSKSTRYFLTNNIYSIYLFESLIENWRSLQTWFHSLC